MDELVKLDQQELLALAGLVRLMIRLDGRFTPEERRALSFVASAVAQPADGGDGSQRLGPERWAAWIEHTVRTLPDDGSIRDAALAVTRQPARDAIHALLTRIASADFAEGGEQGLLRWLAREWNIEY